MYGQSTRESSLGASEAFFRSEIKNHETEGGVPLEFTRYFYKRDILLPVKKALDEVEDINILRTANRILSIISQAIDRQDEFSGFKPIYGFSGEDGSFLIEWIYEDFRVGFSIESDQKDSSWYLVSRENVGGIRASGFLDTLNLGKIINWLFVFISFQINL